jgi:hypothetical protein
VPDDWWARQPPAQVAPDGQEVPPGGVLPGQPTPADCTRFTRTTSVAHTERIWWLLPLNPFVVVADAAPSEPHGRDAGFATAFTPMRWISAGARAARSGPDEVVDECAEQTASSPPTSADPADDALSAPPVWPFGLGFLLVAGAGAAWVSGRRLRTPVRRLPNGTRIA